MLNFFYYKIYSESSMFITKRRFILKTCGTTTPLECIKRFLHFVNEFTGFDEVEDVFYSRKNFERPELQKDTYRNFKLEIQTLDIIFKGSMYKFYLKTNTVQVPIQITI